MKIILPSTNYTFTPSLNRVSFSPMSGNFDPAKLLGIVNVTTGKIIFATGSQPSGLGGTFSTVTFTNDTLTYSSSNVGQNSTDILQVIYEDPTATQTVGGSVSISGQPLDVSAASVPVKLSDGNGVKVLSTVDTITGEDGLNVNLLNSSFGGTVGAAMPLPFNQNALSIGVLNGGTLYAPALDPTSGELQVQAKISDSAGLPINNGQQTMTNSVPVTIASNQSAIPITTTSPIEVKVGQSVSQDILGVAVSGNRNNQIEVSFNSAPGASLITNTFTGSGAVSITNGHSIYSTGTAATSTARAQSVQLTTYRPAHEIYAAFTAAFLNPQGLCQSRIGLFNATNGFAIGYDGAIFSVFVRNNGSESAIDRGSFNVDTLTGASTSKFTRNGTPETLNLALSNLFRIRFAWLGSANILFEVFSPDGEWILFHNIRQPNSSYNPSITTPDLPMTLELVKTGTATNSSIATACWGAGTTSAYSPISSILNDNTLAAMTRSVITGQTTGGGPSPSYVNVKVNPSGALTVENTQSGTASNNVAQYGGVTTSLGQKAMAASMPVVLASDQTIIDVEQPDLYINGAVNIAAGNNLFNNPAGPGGTDAQGYKSGSCQVFITNAGGSIEFQHSSDNSTWVTMPAFRVDSVSPPPIVAPISGTVSSFVYHFPIKMRYIRLNVTSTLAGSPRANLRLSQDSWAPIVGTVVSAVAANLNATVAGSLTSVGTITTVTGVTTVSTVSAVNSAALSSTQVVDVASAAITTTQTSANVNTAATQAASFAVYVTAISGAGAALDVQVQETMNGTDYFTIYQFERITTTGQFYSPAIKLSGSGLRYIRTISGTTPSVTNSVNRIQRSGQAETVRRFINRTIDPNTLNSNTGSFFCDGVEDFNLIVRCTAQTTAATIELQFSTDNTNWFTSTATVTTSVGIVMARIDNQQFKFVRASVTAAGTGITLGEITIGGHSA